MKTTSALAGVVASPAPASTANAAGASRILKTFRMISSFRLLFSAATGEDKTKVALYLLITIAPFAIIAPLIGPLLDRLQHGRRLALAASFALRCVLAVVLVFNFDSWGLYPAALAMMVLSKSFSVLKSAVTPRVLPPEIDLVRVNSRLTVFGLVGGTLGAGGLTLGAGGLGFGAGAFCA